MCEEQNFYVIADIQAKILPGVTHWQSPNFFGYYPSNSSIAGFLGEMMSAGLNIVGFSWITSPAATELEMIVLDWFGKMLKLPEEFLSAGEMIDFYTNIFFNEIPSEHFFFVFLYQKLKKLVLCYCGGTVLSFSTYDRTSCCRKRWWSDTRHSK